MAFPNRLWASSNTTCWFVLRWSTAKDANSCKLNQPCHGPWYYLQHFCRVVLLPCWFIRSIKLKVFRVKKLLSPCCVVSIRSGSEVVGFFNHWERKKNISCCSAVANSDTDDSREKKYFLTDKSILVLYNSFLIFYSFGQSGRQNFHNNSRR